MTRTVVLNPVTSIAANIVFITSPLNSGRQREEIFVISGLALLRRETASIQFQFRKGRTGLTLFTSTRRRRGFTLVELLVVIAIIGVLVALLLPAVQAAREAARRMQCSNNLKQMGLGMHNYHDVYNRLPMGLVGGGPGQPSGSPNDDGFGWGCAILPFMEQQTVYDRVNPNGRPGVFAAWAAANPTTPVWPGGDTRLGVYKCPSSVLPPVIPSLWSVPGNTLSGALPQQRTWWVGYATSDYKGAGGSCWGDDGVLQKNSEIPGGRNFADIVDGLSNVLMIAESSYVNTSKTAPTAINDWPTWIGGLGEDEQIRTNGRTTAPVNCGCKRNNWMTWLSDDCAFSAHPGGAMFLLCDGSVHFISENINIQTYCNMNSVRDGNPIGNWK